MIRITPMCMGSTQYCYSSPTSQQNHPHVYGEYNGWL